MIADKAKIGKFALGRYLDALLVPAIVIVVGVAAFGLGRLSALEEHKGGLVVHPAAEERP